ncbi:MAG: ribulose-phosphate 3-epimerase [Candidatus Brocadiia bacterium]
MTPIPDIKIAPAIMDSDLAHLARSLQEVESGGADLIHVDIMDGHFVPSFVGGPRVLAAMDASTQLPLDVHLMVSNPDTAVDWFLEAGADIILFHPETSEDPMEVIDRIHEADSRAGLALKPKEPALVIEPFADKIECVMAMTVEPGFSGQKFMEEGCRKIPELREMCGNNVDVYVDGGINGETAPVAVKYGANVLAAASAIFSAEIAPPRAISYLRKVAEEARQ